MSEKNNGSKNSSKTSAVIGTVVVAALAVAAIVVLVMMNNKPSVDQTLPDGTTVSYRASQELADECGERARELMSDNYKTIRLFITEGLPHKDEPYGNRPEDGYYTVNSEEFKLYEQLESFVKSVYTESEAERILTKMPSDPAVTLGGVKRENSENNSENTSETETRPETIAVYQSRDVYVDIQTESETSTPKVPTVVVPKPSESGAESAGSENGETEVWDSDLVVSESDESVEPAESVKPVEPTYTKQSVLGISEYFVPYTEYDRPWNSISIKVVPSGEEECFITVYLGSDRDVNLSSVDDSDIISTKMVKENGEWKLTELVY